jgi:hypothetical protein
MEQIKAIPDIEKPEAASKAPPPNNDLQRQAERTLLRERTEDFARFWLVYCADLYKEENIEMQERDVAQFTANPSFANTNNVKFYKRTLSLKDNKPPPPISEKLRRAAITLQTCMCSVFMTLERIKLRLREVEEVVDVQWMNAHVRPRLLIHVKDETGAEQTPTHDFIRIKTSSGALYVLDLAGWQFGFEGWFYDWDDYVRDCLANPDTQPLKPEEQSAEFLREQTPERRTIHLHLRSHIENLEDKKLGAIVSSVTL